MTTSVDWGNELLKSLWWIAEASAITAIVLLVVGAILIRSTEWGRQFWRISAGYFDPRTQWRDLLIVAVVLVMQVSSVRLTVLLTYQGNDLYTSLQNAFSAIAQGDKAALNQAENDFWFAMKVFFVLATIHVVRSMFEFWIGQVLQIRWRIWLNNRAAGDWLRGDAYYRSRFVDSTIDNPDQRIQQDVDEFTRGAYSLAFGGMVGEYVVPAPGVIGSCLTIVSFTTILWELSGPLTVLGTTVPHALVWGALIYVTIATVIAFWVGRPLIRLNFSLQALTASFRYALIRLRDSAERVAFYRGQEVERAEVFRRFDRVIDNRWRLVYRDIKFNAWNLAVSQVAAVFAIVLQAPRLFAGQIKLGDLTQSAQAFSNVHDSLSILRNSYDAFTYFRSTLVRLDGMLSADEIARDLPKIVPTDSDDSVTLSRVTVRLPDGTSLIDDLSLVLNESDAIVVSGASGSGKTTLLRSLAGLWPWCDGDVAHPPGSQTMFLSQMPYMPLGPLRTALTYPAKDEEFSDDRLRQVLHDVFLPHLADRFDEVQLWDHILSPGEQQRVAFARILLNQPKVVFLDEATSSIDQGLEYTLYSTVREQLPGLILVSVAHRSTVDVHHDKRLTLAGDGTWSLDDIAN
ncbi:ABC transporter ATP-binding protein/permease [Smaragdicoccus niigatensis]|uniref:ABC transporter ATP-binding protein/permease n=1 Tax=Smaragdicoccus niigatensis TaxID=359359 RepID=UPI00037759AE|nr:ABC transporter ATP-binding protein/permease [Smaragdicoccus niigatensis]